MSQITKLTAIGAIGAVAYGLTLVPPDNGAPARVDAAPLTPHESPSTEAAARTASAPSTLRQAARVRSRAEQPPKAEPIRSNPDWEVPVKAPKWRKQARDRANRPGTRIHPITGTKTCHSGLDLATALGRPVRATAAGRARALPNNGGAGHTIRINHGQGLVSHYFHLSEFSKHLTKEKFDEVKKGQIVGFVGTTGMSTGPHLHLEVTINDKTKDPRHWLLKGTPIRPACPKGDRAK